MGIDSLVIFEIESRIWERVNDAFTSDELTACTTVRDLEALLSTKGVISLPSVKQMPTSVQTPLNESKVSPADPSVSSVIADIYRPKESNSAADTELEALRMDSLIIFELEDGLWPKGSCIMQNRRRCRSSSWV